MKITEAIKSAILSISVTIVSISAVYIICPNGKLKNSVKYLLSLVLLLSVTAPILKIDLSATKFESEQYISASQYDLLESQAEYVAETLLSSEGIKYKKMQISTDISKDGNIFISSIAVYGASNPEKAKQLLVSAMPYSEVKVYGN